LDLIIAYFGINNPSYEETMRPIKGEGETLLPGNRTPQLLGNRTSSRVLLGLAALALGLSSFAVLSSGSRRSTSAATLDSNGLGSPFAPAPQNDVKLPSAEAETDACVLSSSGPVLDGYDVVAYHSLAEDDGAILGSAEYSATYEGYTFYFSNEANKKSFEKKPSEWAPQWGGFCSYGISSESFWTYDTIKTSGPMANPNSWLIFVSSTKKSLTHPF
jgi:YHS domain-containing protein